MAWTAPRTWVTGEVVTAALMNTHVRDNLLETAAATATTAGDLVYADAANSMGSRLAHPGSAGFFLTSAASNALAWRLVREETNFFAGATSDTLTSTTYTSSSATDDFPRTTAITGTAAIVVVSCRAASNNTAGGTVRITYSVSGASTVAATDVQGAVGTSTAANDVGNLMAIRLQTLTAGTNTFQMQASVSTGTGTIHRPRLLVIPL